VILPTLRTTSKKIAASGGELPEAAPYRGLSRYEDPGEIWDQASGIQCMSQQRFVFDFLIPDA
jgi:hypothetical protein